jgi:hypothetical protein
VLLIASRNGIDASATTHLYFSGCLCTIFPVRTLAKNLLAEESIQYRPEIDGHLTLAGARYFAKQMDKTGWLVSALND